MDKEYIPDQDNNRIYMRLFNIYQRAYDSLIPIYEDLAMAIEEYGLIE